jgi:hypothetical protein
MNDDLGEIVHESDRFIVVRRASGDLIVLVRRVDAQGTRHLVTANPAEHEAATREMGEGDDSPDNG